jgi:putative ABC transport system substrate-binding protein
MATQRSGLLDAVATTCCAPTGDRVSRRDALAGLLAVVMAPAARAQREARTYHVAFVNSASPLSVMEGSEPPHPIVRAFIHELRSLGYVEGQNLVLERRTAEGHEERYEALFTELVGRGTQVIVALGGREPFKRAADAVAPTPIVLFAGGDPVKYGLAKSLARPGGNVTGLLYYAGPEIEAKRMQLLREVAPSISRVTYLTQRGYADHPITAAAIQAARNMGFDMQSIEVTPLELDAAFTAIEAHKPDALYVSPYPLLHAHRDKVVAFARKALLPASYAHPEFAELGGLMSYAVDTPYLGRRTAHYVDKILRGEKPGDLPMEMPAKFVFAINLKTAKELGLTIPQSILLRADRVIE